MCDISTPVQIMHFLRTFGPAPVSRFVRLPTKLVKCVGGRTATHRSSAVRWCDTLWGIVRRFEMLWEVKQPQSCWITSGLFCQGASCSRISITVRSKEQIEHHLAPKRCDYDIVTESRTDTVGLCMYPWIKHGALARLIFRNNNRQ